MGSASAGCVRFRRSISAAIPKDRMQANAKTYSSEVNRWAKELQRRRTGIALNNWRPVIRILSLMQRLTEQFARRAMVRHGMTQLLLRHASLGRSWFRRSTPQVHFSWQISLPADSQVNNRSIFVSSAATPAEHRTRVETLALRELRRQSTILRAEFVRQTTANFAREICNRSTSTILMDGAIPRVAASQLALGYPPAPRIRSSRPEPESAALVKRVLQQSRRIEEQVTPVRTVLVRRGTVSSQLEQFADSAPLPQGRPTRASPSWAVTTPQPAFNINHITDEVVRKLDSRLVAARERFGKI
jgi:hypothetical protein